MIPILPSSKAITEKFFEEVKSDILIGLAYVLKNGCTIKTKPYTAKGDERTYLKELQREPVLKKLILSSPNELSNVRAQLVKRFPSIHSTTNDLNRLLYNVFVLRAYKNLDKHKFISHLDLDTCSYCNRNYTYSLAKSEEIKPEIDHFYPKSCYPYFGVSFYNLIPSCQTCNGFGGKEEKDPFSWKMKSPYLMNSDDFEFSYDLLKLDYLSPLDGNSSIKVKFTKEVSGNVKALKLDKLYEKHGDHVLELIVKSKLNYAKKYREYLKKYKGMKFSDSEIDRMIIGNYTSLNELHKRPFSKLYKDIALELGLII